ncbi:hypothetical protein RDV89_12825 [Nocardioides zeae]|uniref:Secreted protein n=1 Tax=Nocardioides imazamoxiresistens TaxID=3231893 RepID=A0ABU3PXJ5_9ACTN|nr:hypothetical protein [Nocardioides zeae]MDT9593958.1 hypothetical protein [Nocardioides zeae]
MERTTWTGALLGAVTALAVVGGAVALSGSAGAAEAPGAAPNRGWVPPGDTIVEVTGDAGNGFGIHHYDGSALFPPTLSESTAECTEYDTEVQVAVCIAEVETWYRDLADLQVALRWAHQSSSVGGGPRVR